MASMDDLPPSLQLEILNRINDSTNLALCRMCSKTLNALSYDVRSLNIICSFDRYLKSRTEETEFEITPFKQIVKKLLLNSRNLETIHIGIENSLNQMNSLDHDYEVGKDDLNLTDVDFVSEWLPQISGSLKSISISGLWIQSWWEASSILALISSCCTHLDKLELKHAFLSVEGLKPMMMLTSLTLDQIKLDDQDLNKLNECFPNLLVLNLIKVDGLNEPKLHFLHLQTCKWIVPDFPRSLTIITPNLVILELKCLDSRRLCLKAPLLSILRLQIGKITGFFEVENFLNLKGLQIDSGDICNLIDLFPKCRTVEKLILNSYKRFGHVRENLKFEQLVSTFPNLSSIVLQPGACSELESSFSVEGLNFENDWRKLKQLKAYVSYSKTETTHCFISSLLRFFTTLTSVEILPCRGVGFAVKARLVDCVSDCCSVKWTWGMWRKAHDEFHDSL